MKHIKSISIVTSALLLSLFSLSGFANWNTEHSAVQKQHPTPNSKTNVPPTALEVRVKKEDAIWSNPLGIVFYKPNYIMPFYYTWKPYQTVYAGQTPDNQSIDRKDFKAQISFLVPLWHNIAQINTLDLNFAYSQLFYWQFYVSSQYFRETNYEPEVFLSWQPSSRLLTKAGVVHQSNGKGGSMERSWNRIYADFVFSGQHWIMSVKPWILIFKKRSSNVHNPDIADYLGHERLLFAYKFHYSTVSLTVRNIERPTRTTFIGDITFPITKHISGYIQGFSGYGQSLIEYDHRTNAAGIGISLSNWI